MLLAHRVDDLVIANLTLHNTTPQGGSQAEAIILNGTPEARAIITSVDLISCQDTLQINGQAYLSDCTIEGDVDFMWGTGPCYFENCRARSLRNNAYYTQIRNRATNHGYVYKDCTFDGAPGVTGNVLSQIAPTRFPASEVVLIDCTLSDAVSPVAWRLDQATEAPGVHFWEFNSHDPGGKTIDTRWRLAPARQLKPPDDREIVSNESSPSRGRSRVRRELIEPPIDRFSQEEPVRDRQHRIPVALHHPVRTFGPVHAEPIGDAQQLI